MAAATASSPSSQAVAANAGDAIPYFSIGASLHHQRLPRPAPSHARNAAFLPSLALPWQRLHLHLKAPSLPPHQRRHASIPFAPRAQSNLVRKVTAKELDNILDGTRNCPIVVDFYAHWCGPCKLLSEELEQLAAEYGDTVKFLKVDTDEEFELASEMQIQGLPTLIFVSKNVGKNAIRTEGLLPADVIRTIIENEL